MKKHIALLLILFIVVSCQSSPTSDANPTQVSPSLEITATPTIAQLATEQVTTEVPTLTPATKVLFRDDFNKQLQPGWQWINEKQLNWSLSEYPGFLRLNAATGYINLHNAINVLLTPAPVDKYIIETSLSFNPSWNNQFAGLIMYETDDEYIQAGIAYCFPIDGCVGRGIYIDIYQNGRLTLPRNTVEFTRDGLAIRILHNGDNFTVYTSQDGSVWYRIYKFTTDIVINQVGLISGQSTDQSLKPALFDYFQISAFE